MRSLVQLAVALQGGPLALKVLRQRIDEVDRAVLAAGAAHGYGRIAAVVEHHLGQPVVQKPDDVFPHLEHCWLLRQKLRNRRLQPGVAAQIQFVIRIGQHAYIKHVIAVHGNAVFEAK